MRNQVRSFQRINAWSGHASLLALLLVALSFPGCVKFRQDLTVNTDGSGKIDISYGIRKQMLGQVGVESPLSLGDLQAMIDPEGRGFVAFSEPEVYEKDGYAYQTLTGYFLDVGKIEIAGKMAPPEAVPTADPAYAFDPTGSLTIAQTLLEQVALEIDEQDTQDADTRSMLMALATGLEIVETVTVPGTITEAKPFTAEGPTAEARLNDAVLLSDDRQPVEHWRGAGRVTIHFSPTEWDISERKRWMAELEAARDAWKAWQQSDLAQEVVEERGEVAK